MLVKERGGKIQATQRRSNGRGQREKRAARAVGRLYKIEGESEKKAVVSEWNEQKRERVTRLYHHGCVIHQTSRCLTDTQEQLANIRPRGLKVNTHLHKLQVYTMFVFLSVVVVHLHVEGSTRWGKKSALTM